jgi:DNA-binding response OmpR family regulator
MKRILIVDDDTDLLASLKSYLTKKGYDVTTTTTCNEGLDILYAVSPHLVLLDINVGNEDGRTMCMKIKNTAESEHIPIILISANHQALARYQEYGANGSLPKPFELPVLLDTIEQTMGI